MHVIVAYTLQIDIRFRYMISLVLRKFINFDLLLMLLFGKLLLSVGGRESHHFSQFNQIFKNEYKVVLVKPLLKGGDMVFKVL